jgi:hypothetical protein
MKITPPIYFAIGCALIIGGCKTQPPLSENARLSSFVVYPLEKVHPDTTPPADKTAEIRMAGNEYEIILIGIHNPTPIETVISNVQLEIQSADPIQFGLFQVGYVDITKSSRWFQKSKGRWPDPLIPLTAISEQQDNNSNNQVDFFLEDPVIVPSGENRVFLLEVFLPPNTRKSNAAIVARIFTDQYDAEELSIKVAPYSFDLPQMSSLATAFGMGKGRIITKHEELSEHAFDPNELYLLYLESMAKHRISIYYLFLDQIPAIRMDNGGLKFDWSEFERLTGGMLDGTLFPDLPAVTSVRVPHPPPNLTREERIRFFREFAAHARRNGWLDKVFYYLPDEPMRREYPEVREIASLIKEADPGIRTLATEPYTRHLQGYVDIWCPDVPVIGDSVPFLPFAFSPPRRVHLDWQCNPPPHRYQERQEQGETAWFYTCTSAQIRDYPNLFIDSKASYHRVIPWLAYRYGFSGLLYYDVVYSYRTDANPWISQYQFMSNGDGNLVYPGLPGLPNIKTHKPIPSLRMKLLREGIEDYEYLVIYDRLFGRSPAREMAAHVARKSLRWEHDIAAILDRRNKIAEEIGSD